MQEISLKSMKWENVKAIFRAIADADMISRADISDRTELSLMTVGKVADALLDLGIVRQVKQQKNVAGRRAGILSLNSERYAMILDLGDHAFSMIVLGADLRPVKQFTYMTNDDFTFAENLSLFLKDAAAYLIANIPPTACLGIGVSLPAPYEEQTDRILTDAHSPFSGIRIKEMIRSAFPDVPILIDDAVNAAAASNAYDIPQAENVLMLYCSIADKCVKGALWDTGRLVRGAHSHAGNYGHMMLSRGRTLNSAIRADNTNEDNAAEIAKLVHNIILTVDPHTIVLNSSLPGSADVFGDLVKEELCAQYGYTEGTLPHFSYGHAACRHAHRGLAIRLREDDLYRMIFGE